MIAKVICGKSIRKVLYYNEDKVTRHDAILLDSGGFISDATALSFHEKLERFTSLTKLNERTKTNAMHISLNFSCQDVLDADRLRSIATDYLQQIGWGDQPFLLYQHFDAAHPHVHILTTNINRYGERMETHNIGKNQSERARKAIEESYQLVKAEEQKTETFTLLRPIDLEKVIYGKQPTKAAISGIVREVMATYKFGSFNEYNAILSQFNVCADRGNEDSMMFQRGGLQYRLLNENGEMVGIPIKASSIYTSPTLGNLEKQFPINRQNKKPYGERIKHMLSKAISKATSLDTLQQQLRRNGIRVLFYLGRDGNVFGLSIIDNATRCIFKGSELGKAFSAASLLQQIDHLPKDTHTDPMPAPKTSEYDPVTIQVPAQSEPVLLQVWTTLTEDEHVEESPATLKKKRRIPGLE